MKLNRIAAGALIIAIIGLIIIGGCSQEQSPAETTPAPTQQPSATNTPTPTEQPQTEIELENDGLKSKISPTEGKKVSGVITVSVNNFPSETAKLLVMISPQGLQGDLDNNPNVMMEWIGQPTAGQEILLDTTKVENGVYNLGVCAAPEEAPENYPWIAVVQTQLIVEN